MAETSSPLLLPIVAIDRHHQDDERRQQRERIDDSSDDGQQQHPSAPSLLSLMTRQSMRRQSMSSSLLPVIDEGVGSGSGDDSSHSSSISSHHYHHLRLGDTMCVSHCHCVVWPPIGYATWPPPSDCEQQQMRTTTNTNYGSLNQLHQDDNVNKSRSPLSLSSQPRKGIRPIANHQGVFGSNRRYTHRSLLIATFAFALMTVAIWLPVIKQDPANSYTAAVSGEAYSTKPWGQSREQKNGSGIATHDDDVDDDDDDGVEFFTHKRKSKLKHYASSSSQSALPFYRRSYDDVDGGGDEEESIEVVASDNDESNATTITDSSEGAEDDDNNQEHEHDVDPILLSEASNSLPSNISFADLAGMMLPLYFQKTVHLCIDTIKPAVINHTSIEGNVTTTIFTKTTSVLPGDVFKLRKTMLKTRDMLDAFSPVYSTESSLDDYDEKYDDQSLILRFKPWKNFGVEQGVRKLESNYLNNELDVSMRMSYVEHLHGRRMRRRPAHHESRSKIKDLWYTLRRFLDRGYTLIGDFQDLDHAKIMHSSAQLAQYQLQVWHWHDEFMTFITKNRRHISLYLSLPCKLRKKKQGHHHRCRYVHSHSSHLFWGLIQSERDLPDGNVDKATHVLGRLGNEQLGRAEAYLADVLTREHVISANNLTTTALSVDDAHDEPNVVDEGNEVHEIYHNLRKELRSFLDELDLFGDLLLPHSSIIPEIITDKFSVSENDQPDSVLIPAAPTLSPSASSSLSSILSVQKQTDDAVDVLRTVRNVLGDLNDSYVAYAKYLEWNEYLEEQLKLQNAVETQWEQFRVWANEVDLIAKLNFLRGEIDPSLEDFPAGDTGSTPHSRTALKSLELFLIEQKAKPSDHFVLGNDAGDADSVISSITLAYVESMKRIHPFTPVVSISKDVFVHERPDILLLLKLAGIQDASEKLIFIEDLENIVGNSSSPSQSITLVDHNTLNESLRLNTRKKLIVRGIVDHHVDEGKYLETCAGNHRNIAFRDGKPLVASASTLVAERLRLQYHYPYPPSIGILLLGVILLDSVNLDETVGKVTERDRVAVNDLVVNIEWSEIAMPLTFLTSDEDGAIAVDTTQLFNELQLAKYDPQFWNAIPVARALRYDVKYFHQSDLTEFGISTILMPAADFMEKDGFAESTLAFMETEKMSFLGIMFAFYDEERSFRRQLAFISTDQNMELRLLVESLLNSRQYSTVDLQLRELTIQSEPITEISILLYDQLNVTPSRKEIGPMIEDFFKSSMDY